MVSQRAILKWIDEIMDDQEAKELLSCFPTKYFGRYEKIAEWYRTKWKERTTDFFRYAQDAKLGEELMGIWEEPFNAICPYNESKILCKYAIVANVKSEDVLSALKVYEETVEKLEWLRIGSEAMKFSGKSVFLDLFEEVAERNTSQDFETLSGYKTGFEVLDKVTDGLRKGTVTRLSAYANTGKSKFSYHLTNNLLKQWAKVLYFSLEVNAREVALNLSANFFTKDYYTISKGREIPDFGSYPIESLWIVDNVRSMTGIERVVSKLKPDCVFIDFVQNVVTEDRTEYERMTNVAVSIQNMAVRENVMVFDLSQVSNEWKDYSRGWVIPSKGSGALAHSADISLILTKDVKDSFLSLHVAKNKFGRNNVAIYLMPDYSKSTFTENWEQWAVSF